MTLWLVSLIAAAGIAACAWLAVSAHWRCDQLEAHLGATATATGRHHRGDSE